MEPIEPPKVCMAGHSVNQYRPLSPLDPPPRQTSAEKNEIYHRENLVGPIFATRPPPPPLSTPLFIGMDPPSERCPDQAIAQ